MTPEQFLSVCMAAVQKCGEKLTVQNVLDAACIAGAKAATRAEELEIEKLRNSSSGYTRRKG
jgi:hypothetical protein